ncbi:MAG TPA: CopD family protein [Burkholderiaceae bacterium]|nr:CopD family protein [Burkholderiaceae bacterium]
MTTIFFKFLHLAAAIVWIGGMAFMLWFLRPVATTQLQAAQRAPLMAGVMGRFFPAVWLCIALLMGTGTLMLLTLGMKSAPLGWHLMLGIGLLMFAVFGHLYFGPFKHLKRAITVTDWPEAGRRLGQIQGLVKLNFVLSWLAIAAVFFLH